MEQRNQEPKPPIKIKVAAILMIIIGLASLLLAFLLGSLAALPVYSEASAPAGTLFLNGLLLLIASLFLLDGFLLKNRRVACYFSLVAISFSVIISIIFCPIAVPIMIIPLLLILSDRKNFLNRKFIGTTVLLVMIIGGGIWWWQNSVIVTEEIISFEECIAAGYPALESWPRQCKTPDGRTFIEEIQLEDETAGWQTYRNEEIGIAFDYPPFFELSQLIITDHSQSEHPEIFFGKKAIISLNEPDRDIYIFFKAHTPDYKAFKEGPFTGNKDAFLTCPEPLSYSYKGEVCKIIIFPWGEAVFANSFLEDEGDVSLYTKIYFNNIIESEYRGLEFTIALRDINNKMGHIFVEDGWQGERVYSEARTQSENIINQENLSAEDKNALKLFNQITSTFRFVETIRQIGPQDIGNCINAEGCKDQEELTEFREMGMVDLGIVYFPTRANTNSAYYLLNGSPAIISTEIYQEKESALMVEIEKDPLFLEMNNKHSNVWFWGFSPQFIDKIYFPENKRFVFRYRFVDGCRICHTEYFADVGFDFDLNGNFLGIHFIEIVVD